MQRPAATAFVLLLALALPAGPGTGVAAQSQPAPRVWIRAGWFTMGATLDDVTYARRLCVGERAEVAVGLRSCGGDELFASETPARRVHLAAYGLDRYEVSRAEHVACVRAGGCAAPEVSSAHPALDRPELPASGLSWSAAAALCRFRGGRLPSEAEWERAARGDSHRRFPWGDFYDPKLANHGAPNLSFDPSAGRPSGGDGHAFAADVLAFGQGQSRDGLVQMAGNVWEWTADVFAPLAAQASRVDPVQRGEGGQRVVRGGSFRSPAFALRVTHREGRDERSTQADLGVRCAYDVQARHTP